jgi:hypothetical protein
VTGPCDLALVFHGAVVLLLGQVAGYVFFRAIRRAPESARTGMWRMSHAACSAGAVLLIALGPVAPRLALAPAASALFAGSMVFSTYALCLGTVVAGASGHRGTDARPPWPNRVVHGLYVLGALGSTVAGLLLAYGAGAAYLAGPAR